MTDSWVIPFLARADDASYACWLDELQAALDARWPPMANDAATAGTGTAASSTAPARIEVKRFSSLSAKERRDARLAIVANPDPQELALLPALEWAQSLWAGVETLLESFAGRDVSVARLVDPRLGEAMNEAVLSWTLYLHRDMPRYLSQQRDRVWTEHDLRPAAERRVGVLGLGVLGEQAARTLQRNGFSVAGWSRSPKQFKDLNCFAGDKGLTQLLAQSDILVVLLPLTPETRAMLNAHRLQQLPRGASLINAGRGPIIPEADLLAALDSGQIEHAVLDVFDQEPLPRDHPYWANPGVSVMPHVAAPTDKRSASKIAAEAVTRWVAHGHTPIFVDRTRGY